jgi:two-component system LytT family sensor kinase
MEADDRMMESQEPSSGRPTEDRRPFWLLVSGVWLVLALFMTSQLYLDFARANKPLAWYDPLGLELLYCAQWVALARLSLWLAGRFPLARKGWILAGLVHLITGVVLSSLTMGVRAVLHWLLIRHMQTPLTGDEILDYMTSAFDYGVMSYLLNLVLSYSFQYYTQLRQRELRAANLETELGRAQLQALKMQLHPHFFFNTLHAIAVLIRKDQTDRAVEMITQLGKFLRLTFEKADSQEVSLKEELEALSLYLEIQQVRFGDRLTVERDIDLFALSASVPALILQPLVENALQHGIEKRTSPGVIELKARRSDGMVHLYVTDNGPGLASDWRLLRHRGIGLDNTRSRLEKLYGSASLFELVNAHEGGAVAHLVFPYTEHPARSAPEGV